MTKPYKEDVDVTYVFDPPPPQVSGVRLQFGPNWRPNPRTKRRIGIAALSFSFRGIGDSAD